jgi:hypothetical protein
MVLHFQAIQPGQQDRRRQPRGEKADRAARDDRDDPVLRASPSRSGKIPGNGSASSGSATMVHSVPSKSLKIPAAAGIAAKRCEQVGIVGHSPTVPAAPAPH